MTKPKAKKASKPDPNRKLCSRVVAIEKLLTEMGPQVHAAYTDYCTRHPANQPEPPAVPASRWFVHKDGFSDGTICVELPAGAKHVTCHPRDGSPETGNFSWGAKECNSFVKSGHWREITQAEAAELRASKGKLRPEPKFKVGQYIVCRNTGAAPGVPKRIVKVLSGDRYEYRVQLPDGREFLVAECGEELAPLTPGCYDADRNPCPEEFKSVDGRKKVPVGKRINPVPRGLRRGDSYIGAVTGLYFENVESDCDGSFWIVEDDPDYKPACTRLLLWHEGIKAEPGDVLVRAEQDGNDVPLMAVDEAGSRRSCGALTSIGPSGAYRYSSVNPDLGLPLDYEGRVRMNE
ncbi:MAG: hypothetical protein PHU85_03115 [Phycisphaerae bacterium]|nr:hypothetical protein [Phycisphaerae bacterium]